MKQKNDSNARSNARKIMGCSTEDFILFSKSTLTFGVGAYLKGGNVERLTSIDLYFDTKKLARPRRVFNFALLLLIIMEIVYFAIFIKTGAEVNTVMLMMMSISAYIRYGGFMNSVICQVFNLYGYRQLARNHAAEHMAANAYEALGRVPKDIDELKKFSRIHERCGDVKEYAGVFLHIIPAITYTFAYQFGFWAGLLSSMGVLILMLTLHESFDVFKYAEYITLRKPKELELKLALEAITHFDECASSIPDFPECVVIVRYNADTSEENCEF